MTANATPARPLARATTRASARPVSGELYRADLALEDRHFNDALPDFLGRQVRLRQDVAVRRVILRHLADHLIQLVQRHFPAHGGRNDSLEFGALKNRVAAEGDSGDDQLGVSGARRGWHHRLFDDRRWRGRGVQLLLSLRLLSLPLVL